MRLVLRMKNGTGKNTLLLQSFLQSLAEGRALRRCVCVCVGGGGRERPTELHLTPYKIFSDKYSLTIGVGWVYSA